MTPELFRQLALSFPEAVEGWQRGKIDFRVGGRIFATLGYPDAAWGMVKLTPSEQAWLLATEPEMFRPVLGTWGQRGSTHVQLTVATELVLQDALQKAWRRQAPARLLRRNGQTT